MLRMTPFLTSASSITYRPGSALLRKSRVLKPGGRFFFEEVTKHALDRWFYRTFLEHPKANRFSAEEFVAELETQGIMVGEQHLEWFFGDFVVGVGRRLNSNGSH